MLEKRLLQLMILLAGFVPVIAGSLGVWEGAAFVHGLLDRAGDSQFRYLSGLLMGVGLAFWACIPTIERRGETVRALTAVVVVGGVARALGWFTQGDPGGSHWALVMELGVAPMICVWQGRVARGRLR